MRKLTPIFLTESCFEAWQKRARQAREKLLEDMKTAGSPNEVLNKAIWQDFKKEILMRYFPHGKCVFCEGRYIAGAPDDCEHFRPKGAVTDKRKVVVHPGYFWLAYEWQNLLLACRNCNSNHTRNASTGETHPGKLNEFPVSGVRVAAPCTECAGWWDELKQEQPLLLHPYFDEPEKHFKAAAHGAIMGRTEEGRTTIEICDLNRADLMADREREEIYARERLKRAIDDGKRPKWFTVDEPFSMYLNSRLLQMAKATLPEDE